MNRFAWNLLEKTEFYLKANIFAKMFFYPFSGFSLFLSDHYFCNLKRKLLCYQFLKGPKPNSIIQKFVTPHRVTCSVMLGVLGVREQHTCTRYLCLSVRSIRHVCTGQYFRA